MKTQGKTFIDVEVVSDIFPQRTIRVRIDDVAKYYAEEARSMSGCRTLAGMTGDWRPVDYIAQDCLEYFKQVNVVGMRKAGKKYGLTPKF